MKWFLTESFYLFSVLVILFHAEKISHPGNVRRRFLQRARELSATQSGGKHNLDAYLKEHATSLLWRLTYVVWLMTGLFTSYWVDFLLLFLLLIGTIKLREQHWIGVFIYGVLSLALTFNILTQHYHGVDLFKIIF